MNWVSVVGECGEMSIQVLGTGAATAGISAAMLGILAANILKDVSDHCCQVWLGWPASVGAERGTEPDCEV